MILPCRLSFIELFLNINLYIVPSHKKIKSTLKFRRSVEVTTWCRCVTAASNEIKLHPDRKQMTVFLTQTSIPCSNQTHTSIQYHISKILFTSRFLASLVAVFGESDISGDHEPKKPVSRNVRKVIVHRQYDAATFENDLALLELDTPIKFDAHIGKIVITGIE